MTFRLFENCHPEGEARRIPRILDEDGILRFAQNDKNDTMFKKVLLENGLRIIFVPLKSTKAVTVLVLVGTGSKYETKDINGISHFLEHMFFKGTSKRPNTLAIAEELDRVGGSYNAFTSKEYTGYWTKVSSQHLDLALDVVSDIFLHSKLDPQEIERERRVIIEEINMYRDTPMQYVGVLFEKLLYGDQPAGWEVIGTKEVVSQLKRKHFLDYLDNHYLAGSTLVCIAGDEKTVQSSKSKVQSYFKATKRGRAGPKKRVVEEQKEPQSLVYYKKTDQTHLVLGVRGYDLFHPDRYALALLGVILGGNMSSRLFIRVREKLALAYYISTGIDQFTDSGYLFTRAGVDNNKAEKAIKTILKEYQRIAAKGIKPKELKKAQDYIRGSTVLGLESSDAWASFVGFQELLTGKILTLKEKFAKIDAVRPQDIQRVARDIFVPSKLNLALIGPFKDKERFKGVLGELDDTSKGYEIRNVYEYTKK